MLLRYISVLFILKLIYAQQLEYAQCGGYYWTGPTNCAAGLACFAQDFYYSQCLKSCPVNMNWECYSSQFTSSTVTTPSSKKSTTTVTRPINPQPEYAQCGGYLWMGSEVCESGLGCYKMNMWYSQCLKSCPNDWECSQTTTTTSARPTNPLPWYSQCGGFYWTGSETCDNGLTCFTKDMWYSQCLFTCPDDPNWECSASATSNNTQIPTATTTKKITTTTRNPTTTTRSTTTTRNPTTTTTKTRSTTTTQYPTTATRSTTTTRNPTTATRTTTTTQNPTTTTRSTTTTQNPTTATRPTTTTRNPTTATRTTTTTRNPTTTTRSTTTTQNPTTATRPTTTTRNPTTTTTTTTRSTTTTQNPTTATRPTTTTRYPTTATRTTTTTQNPTTTTRSTTTTQNPTTATRTTTTTQNPTTTTRSTTTTQNPTTTTKTTSTTQNLTTILVTTSVTNHTTTENTINSSTISTTKSSSLVKFPRCKFRFGLNFQAYPVDYSLVDYISIWAYPDFNIYWHGAMLNASLSFNATPVFYGYITAFLAGQLWGLNNCYVSSPNLCEKGSEFIRQNRALILSKYKTFANEIAKIIGKNNEVIWLIEPDFWQYYGDSRQQNGTLSGIAMRLFFDDIATNIKSELPKALFSWNISPWLNQSAMTTWWGFFATSPYINFIHTSGGQSQANSENIISNQLSWSFMSSLTGRRIIADTGYHVGGTNQGHNTDWDTLSYLKARILDGVISVTQANSSSTWSATLSQLRSSLAPFC